jgi:NAD(P)-dependent dehydrogenase (short-subunit alcohol dehydrogenase family)
MTAAVVLITGAASGLGAEFLQYYHNIEYVPLIAIDLNPIKLPAELRISGRVQSLVVNVALEEDIVRLADTLRDRPIQSIIHCAGIRGLVPEIARAQPGNVGAAETLEAMNPQTMIKAFEINCVGTFNLIRALLPNLRLASKASPKCIILGSRMGSMHTNTAGGGYAYRASKAALNAVVKSFSIDVPEVMFALLHPGRVETGLVACKEEGAVSVQESVRDCAEVIQGLTLESSGAFMDRFGQKIQW